MNERRNDWLSKTLAGTVLGLGLAMAIAGLVAWGTPGGPVATNKFQFVMWLVAPIWVGVLSFCYLFRNGLRAWVWLGAANVVAFAGLGACRHFLA